MQKGTPGDFDGGAVIGPIGVGHSQRTTLGVDHFLSTIRGRQVIVFDPRGVLNPLDQRSRKGELGEGCD